MIVVRNASPRDRKNILRFCTRTFSWGDYIKEVWDIWMRDERGQLLVAELDARQVGLSHVTLCPDSLSIWLEGLRVDPSHRRAGIATALIDEMLRFGRKHRARKAHAIVARDNKASQGMMEENGFSVISEWSYYSTDDRPARRESGARLACKDDLDSIIRYLSSSGIYKRSARTYVRSWHWYPLDRAAIREFLEGRRIIVSGDPIGGLALVNSSGYWKRKNILQLVYLDSQYSQALQDLVAFAENTRLAGSYGRLQVMCAHDKKIDSLMHKLSIPESERFLLYSRVLSG